MSLTDDELDNLEAAAYLCDCEPFSRFEQNVLPKLGFHTAGELLALSGMFLYRSMPDIARFIAAYAYAIAYADREGNPPPDPRLFLRRMKAEEALPEPPF